MTIANTLDRLVKWTEENICSKIKLKVPPEDIEAATDADYEYKEATNKDLPLIHFYMSAQSVNCSFFRFSIQRDQYGDSK